MTEKKAEKKASPAIAWQAPLVRPPYWRERRTTVNNDPSMTKAEFAKDCDINEIVRRSMRGEVVTHLNRQNPLYGDFESSQDLVDVMQRVQTAQENFEALPANVRRLADNDAGVFLALWENQDPELLKLITPQDPETDQLALDVVGPTGGKSDLTPESPTGDNPDGGNPNEATPNDPQKERS